MQMTTITKSKSVSFSFLSRPTDPVLLLIFYLKQEIKVEWPQEQAAKTQIGGVWLLLAYD